MTDARTDLTDFHGATLHNVLTNKPAGKPIEALACRSTKTTGSASQMGGKRFLGSEGHSADLSGYDLRKAPSFATANLTAVRAEGTIFYGLDLEGVKLQGAKLNGADFRACRLEECRFARAQLAGALLNCALICAMPILILW